MDLELTDEQNWLSESIDTLLEREWMPAEAVAEATAERRRRVWEQLVAFGALTIGGQEGLGTVELCLIARALGSRLASVPFVGSAAVRLALARQPDALSVEIAQLLSREDAIALAVLEPGSSWSSKPATTLLRVDGRLELRGEKVAIEQLEVAARIAVLAILDGQPAIALVPGEAPGVVWESQPSFDPSIPIGSARFEGVHVRDDAVVAGPGVGTAVNHLTTVGAVLAAAEAIGAANAVLEAAVRYAAERRQFGRAIGSFQSIRHLLADMYVRQQSGWSTVLYAAASFDDGAAEAAEAVSVAKAYVSRAAREVAHDAMQVFGGVAFTAEHPAHRYLRRIIVREQQFGDAAHHERALSRALARRVAPPRTVLAEASIS